MTDQIYITGTHAQHLVLLCCLSLVFIDIIVMLSAIKLSVNLRCYKQEWARFSFERKWMGWNGMEWDRTRLNNNGIGFENSVDYHLWIVNEFRQYCSQRTWIILLFKIGPYHAYFMNVIELFYLILTTKSHQLSLKLVFYKNCSWISCVCSLEFEWGLLIFPK